MVGTLTQRPPGVELEAFRWATGPAGELERSVVRTYRFPGGVDLALLEREARLLLQEEFRVADWRLVADGVEWH